MQASGSDKAAAPQANRRASSAKRGAGDFAALLEGGRAQQAGTGPLKPAVIAELRRAASSGGRSTHSQDSDSDQPALQRTGGDPAQSAAGVSAGQTSDPYVDLFTSGEPASEFTRSMEQSGQPDSGQEELKQSAAPVQAQHTEAAGSETRSSLSPGLQSASTAYDSDSERDSQPADQPHAASAAAAQPSAQREAGGDRLHSATRAPLPETGNHQPLAKGPDMVQPPQPTSRSSSEGLACDTSDGSASDGAGTGAPHGSPGAAPSRFASLAGLADALPAVDKLAKEQLESSVGPPSAYLPPSDGASGSGSRFGTGKAAAATTESSLLANAQATPASHAELSPQPDVAATAAAGDVDAPASAQGDGLMHGEQREDLMCIESSAANQSSKPQAMQQHLPMDIPATQDAEDNAPSSASAAVLADELLRQPTPKLPLLSAASISQGPSRYAGGVHLPPQPSARQPDVAPHQPGNKDTSRYAGDVHLPQQPSAHQPKQPPVTHDQPGSHMDLEPAGGAAYGADNWQPKLSQPEEPALVGPSGRQAANEATASGATDKLGTWRPQASAEEQPPPSLLPAVSDRAEAPSPEEIPVSSSALSTDETPEPSSKAESLSEGVSVGEAASMSDFEMVEKEQAQVERSRQTTAALSQAVNEAASTSGQNESDEAWRRERKHMFVLSNAGKPVFAAHGDENALAGFMAIIQAMMSFVQDKGDQLQSIRAGLHLVVFVEKGPFYLVAVSATGEPEAALKLQLELLYGQILSILTNGVEKRFAHNPRYDARGLLGGTYTVLRSLKDSFETDPAAMLSAYLPLPLASTLRHAALTTLQAAVKGVNATWGLLLAGDMVVALAQPRASPMHPLDLLLLSNFVRSTDSFRQSESFSPVCLPYFQPAGHMHAYINYLHQEAGLCLVLLSSQPEQFYTVCPEIAQAAQEQLASTGVTEAVAAAMHDDAHRGRLHIADLPKAAGGGSVGTTPLLHFLYKVPSRGQFIMPAICAPLDTQSARQALMPAYARVHAAMFRASEGGASAGLAPQRVHYSQDSERTMLAYVSPEYEVYAVYDALTDKQTAVQLCHKLGSYIKSQQTDLFVP